MACPSPPTRLLTFQSLPPKPMFGRVSLDATYGKRSSTSPLCKAVPSGCPTTTRNTLSVGRKGVELNPSGEHSCTPCYQPWSTNDCAQQDAFVFHPRLEPPKKTGHQSQDQLAALAGAEHAMTKKHEEIGSTKANTINRWEYR